MNLEYWVGFCIGIVACACLSVGLGLTVPAAIGLGLILPQFMGAASKYAWGEDHG